MYPHADQSLIENARQSQTLPALADCTVDNLRELSAQQGIDFATALLYDRVCHSTRHGSFIRQLQCLATSSTPLPRLDATIVIVPGAFHEQFPQSGANGRVVREQAVRFGCCVETISLPNLGSLDDNARHIIGWLAERPTTDAPIILVSLSKGGSDIKRALDSSDAARAFANVAVWINLSGILNGTPLVTWLFSKSLRSGWTRWLLRRRRYNLDTIRELDHHSGAPLDRELQLPAHMQTIHFVGFPLRRHATNRLARRNHARLEPYGPNDGAGILLGDAVRWPGLLYPVWSADHYLRPTVVDINRLMTALLRYATLLLTAEVSA
jgi:hypothetical protein